MQLNFSRGMWVAVPVAAFVYLYGLGQAGLLGPDEPRYAAVARTMANSGDWITPRLWGQPWFEKPALLYWMSAAGFRAGLGPEMAARLPVAVLALGFLGFYWWILRREFGSRAAWCAALMLGTSAGWMGFSQIGVTDLPMTATFAAALLLALPWISKGDTRPLPLVAALLGVAVLAKGFVPLVLALPLVLRGRVRDLLRWQVILPFVVVACPWYLLCYLRNGQEFVDVFFWQQQFGRFGSPALLHTQPWWFYVPVLLAGLVPWTPLAVLIGRRTNWRDPRRVFLLVWVFFGFIFFSVAVNKLPGYLLPLLPAICALMGVGLAEMRERGRWIAAGLAACALLLVAFPFAARVLPTAVVRGLSRAPGFGWDWGWAAAAVMAGVVWLLARSGRGFAAVAVLAASAAAGFLYVKAAALPQLDRIASARRLWQEIEARPNDVCVESLNRNFRYGLNYYSGEPLPDCSSHRLPLEIRQAPGEAPRIAAAGSVDHSPAVVVPSPADR